METRRNKAWRVADETSVARVSTSTSRCWLVGSTVKTLISVTTRFVVDISGMQSAPFLPSHGTTLAGKMLGGAQDEAAVMQMPVMYIDDPPRSSGGLHPGILVQA